MIRQQVNLYQPMFRKQKVVFAAATMMQITAVFLLLFACLYAYQAYQLQPYQEQLQVIDNEIATLSMQLNRLEKKTGKQSKSKLLEKEIANLQGQLQKRERIARVLGDRTFGNNAGFSAYLESFARQHIEGTWLTRITVESGGRELGLNGKTLSSELVPSFIQNLSTEDAMKGATFNVMEIARVENKSGEHEIQFTVRTN